MGEEEEGKNVKKFINSVHLCLLWGVEIFLQLMKREEIAPLCKFKMLCVEELLLDCSSCGGD